MKPRNTLIGLVIAAALGAAVGAYSFNAFAREGAGYGWGMMGGYGPGYSQGDGPGYGPMRGYGPVMGTCTVTGAATAAAKVTGRGTTCAVGVAGTAPACRAVMATGRVTATE